MINICNSCEYKLSCRKCFLCKQYVCFSCIIDKFNNDNVNDNGTCYSCYNQWDINMQNNYSIHEINEYLQEQEKKYTDYCLSNGTLVQCENCGNIWDGNAQCNCWLEINLYESSEEETISQLNIDYNNEDNFNPIIYGYEPTSVTEINLF